MCTAVVLLKTATYYRPVVSSDVIWIQTFGICCPVPRIIIWESLITAYSLYGYPLHCLHGLGPWTVRVKDEQLVIFAHTVDRIYSLVKPWKMYKQHHRLILPTARSLLDCIKNKKSNFWRPCRSYELCYVGIL